MKVAALYVQKNGIYFGLPDVDPWDEERDARLYDGPWPVVAHPPCARWGRYWRGRPGEEPGRYRLGDDGGCFSAALEAVRRWGGVLEHPQDSRAWAAFGLPAPPRSGGWILADEHGGWTCRVEQGHFGHVAQKATWLYACHTSLPSLPWGPSHGSVDTEGLEDVRRRARIKRGRLENLSHRQRAATPAGFRDLLIAIARTSTRQETTP